MVYAPRDITEFAYTHETSIEVALAIFQFAPAGDEERMWADPDVAEAIQVENYAWELADPDTEALHWGIETLRRAA